MYESLKNKYFDSCAITIIHRRLKHFDDSSHWEHAERVCKRLARIGSQLTPAIHSSVLRTVCNAWCTSARFQEHILPCRFCGEHESDALRHYMCCTHSFTALQELLPYGVSHDKGDGLAHFGMFAIDMDEQQILINAIMVDALQWAFNNLRVGATQSIAGTSALKQLLHARMRQQSIRNVCCRRVLQMAQRSNDARLKFEPRTADLRNSNRGYLFS